MKFSASMIKTWMACPLQAKFSYTDGLPQLNNAAASFGSCVHAALEHYNTYGDADAAVQWFLFYWEHPEELDVVPDIWPKRSSYAGYREKGIEMVNGYIEACSWATSREVIAVEHKFKIPFGDHELSGIVDVLEFTNNKLKIVDLKTGYRPNQDNLYLNIQFTIYWLASMKPEFWMGNGAQYPALPDGEALFEKYQKAQRQAIWWDLKNLKEYDVGRRDDKDFMRLYRCCEEINKAIAADVYVPCISGDTCLICSYTDICNAYIPQEDSGKGLDDVAV